MVRGRHLGDPHLTMEGTWGPGRAEHCGAWGLPPQHLCMGVEQTDQSPLPPRSPSGSPLPPVLPG